ncbi:hypothetical protein DPMN_109997 [Dreissena polymorpha]|uniref:Uncharacterized protein n=1 Tax=Dreissena polymorpha TaxID=45954 RepID=A0A9D4QMI8_DREPO|nr:hypothetical protein DPMN_109997 [Dreissena polymorpha]
MCFHSSRKKQQWRPGLIMGPCIVEIDRIVVRYVQYQFEVSRCRNEEFIRGQCGRGRPRVGNGPCIIEIDRIVIRDVQYQLEVNQAILDGRDLCGRGRPRSDRIVIREVQYQFAILCGCGLCGRGAPGLVMGPCLVEIDRIVIRVVQYQYEVNGCRNKEVYFQGSSAYSVRGDSGQVGRTDGRTDRRTAEITTITTIF